MNDMQEIEDYLIKKYKTEAFTDEDIKILANLVKNVYLNRAFPFSIDKSKEDVDYDWVLIATMTLIEKGDIDITQFSENGILATIGASLMSEITPKASTPKSKKVEDVEEEN